ncbi:MAG: P-loop NTPase [Chloroflexi bacterium]|nr:P-loop NTPase [Chloroflexota bacterium]
MTVVNLNGILTALVQWWWLLATASGMAGLITYHTVRQTAPTYVASTTLLVGDVLRRPRPGEGEFGVTQNLANGYAQLAQRQPILEAVVTSLGLPLAWEELRRRIVVVHPSGAFTIEIRVMDGNPTRARDIAAAIADQLVAASPTTARRQELEQRRRFATGELDALQQKIEQGRDDLEKKRAAAEQETSARGVLDRQDEIKALEANLASWRTSYNDLLASLEGRAVDPNSLTVIEPAEIPSAPAGPRGTWYVLLAAVSGGLLAAIVVISMDVLDDKIRSREDLREALRDDRDGPVAYIPRLEKGRSPLAVVAAPESLAADAYRLLAAQLRFGMLGPGRHIVLVTSAANSEGKSTTAANLASALALGGSQVLLMDLDLRNPVLHTIFGLPNRGGASAMLRDHDFAIDRYALQTALPRLKLLPAGTPLGNPSEQLSMSGESLVRAAWNTADFVIVDGPPLLAVADASVLGAVISDTLFVARCDRTNGRDLCTAIDILSGLPTRLRAVVLNAVAHDQMHLTGYRYPRARGALNAMSRGRSPSGGPNAALPAGPGVSVATPRQHDI